MRVTEPLAERGGYARANPHPRDDLCLCLDDTEPLPEDWFTPAAYAP